MRPLPYTLFILLALPTAALAGLNNSYQQTGNLGLEVTGVAGGNGFVAIGTLTLNNVPPTAQIQKATLYASQTNNPNGIDAFFGGANLGIGAFVSDVALIGMYSYWWDVTVQMTPGQNSYSFAIGQNTLNASAIAGVALSVIWQDPAEPVRTIVLFDGMQQVGESGAETESISFGALVPGNTTAWLFTVNDDNASTGETITYNSNTIGGPIDRNLGFDASLFQLSTNSSSSGNTLSISTGLDHMGWMIGAVAVDTPPVKVESSSWGRVKSLFD